MESFPTFEDPPKAIFKGTIQGWFQLTLLLEKWETAYAPDLVIVLEMSLGEVSSTHLLTWPHLELWLR